MDLKHFSNLPAADIAGKVNQILGEHNRLVITAPPGAGKSTLLPLTILEKLSNKNLERNPKILILEPRRMAARQIAERMATILGEPIGRTIGYRIRFEKKVSAKTKIEVLTEGVLTRMLIQDATLSGIDAIIFDEFHERNINSDLALALARQTQQLIRPDLKIIIMSATIDTRNICQALQAPLVESKGKIFPVKVYHTMVTPDVSEIAQVMASTIIKAAHLHDGDILAFLPGQGEILKCEQLLNDQDNFDVYPLYGNLPQEKQNAAIAPSANGKRKIVLATPIAETSLTIEGIKIVVDSGLCRKVFYDANTGLSHLETVRISLDMAEQRKGRAGRLNEGVCYQLWTLATEHQMTEMRKPEIEEAELSSLLLDIVAFGESDIASLPWLTTPPIGNVIQAQNLLQILGAISCLKNNSADGNASKQKLYGKKMAITPLGQRMAIMPCHPRISKMILSASTSHLKSLSCDIAALLEERDPLVSSNECSLALRISILRSNRRKSSLFHWSRIAQISKEYSYMSHGKEDNSDISEGEIGKLLAYAYPERIAKSMDNIGNYRLANGTAVKINLADSISSHEWICIASLHASRNKGKVFLAAPIDMADLKEMATSQKNVAWDRKQGRIIVQQEMRIGGLTLDTKPIQDIPKDEVISIICDIAQKDGLNMFNWNEEVQRLQLRVGKVKEWHPELKIPDISTKHLLEIVDEWLPFYLESSGHVKTSIPEFKKLNLKDIIWNLIPYELQEEINYLAPTHIKVPTGSKIKIDYRQGTDIPVLSVRLQECFGLQESPTVNGGKVPVLMELLSPGFKPVQLTQDLRSFWQGTYFEVRKELKRRYPKHSWPDNPMETPAVRGVKRT